MLDAFDPKIQDWADIAAFAGVLGICFGLVSVWVAVQQLRRQTDSAMSQFESIFLQQYLHLTQKLPIEALLGEPLVESDLQSALPEFYHYIDLCNSQAFLFKNRKIRRSTWAEWESGIIANFAKPAFQSAWRIVSSASPSEFDDLREVMRRNQKHLS